MKKKFPQLVFSLMYNWNTYLELPRNNLYKAKSKNLVYAGNIGIAQNVEIYIKFLAELSKYDIKIDFYAFGDQLKRLKMKLKKFRNINFKPVIDPDKLNHKLLSAHGGLVFLDSSLHLDNIPGKILSYLGAGRPVFGYVNRGSELIDIINKNNLGLLCDNIEQADMKEFVDKTLRIMSDFKPEKIQKKAKLHFSLDTAIKQITQRY